MDKEQEICKFLREFHKGKERAVFSCELERLFSLTGRSLRRIISSLRQEGYPICSDCKGYYYAQTQEEVNSTVSRLNELVTGVSNSRTGLLYARVEPQQMGMEIIIRIGGNA